MAGWDVGLVRYLVRPRRPGTGRLRGREHAVINRSEMIRRRRQMHRRIREVVAERRLGFVVAGASTKTAAKQGPDQSTEALD
jgi:hypothetical protein